MPDIRANVFFGSTVFCAAQTEEIVRCPARYDQSTHTAKSQGGYKNKIEMQNRECLAVEYI